MLNWATQIALTKLDILFPDCKGASDYNSLNEDAVAFVENVEEELGLPVTFIGTGPGVREIIDRRA
jgi:adenylosuccinate synthase